MIAFNKFKLNDFQFIILALLPLAFIVGPLIVEIIINILILIFIFNVIRNKKFDFIKNNIFICLFIFYIILLISHFQSSYFDETKINDTFSTIHPKRNIDSGDCIERQAPFISSEAMNVENNLSNVSLLGYTLCAAIILYLVILRVKR